MDYAAIAVQYGGKSAPSGASSPDYAALAAQFGGQSAAAPAPKTAPADRGLLSRIFMRDPNTPEPPTLFSDPSEQVSPEAARKQAIGLAGFAVGYTADIGNALLNMGFGGAEKLKNALTSPSVSDLVAGKRALSTAAQWNADRSHSIENLGQQFTDPADQAVFGTSRLLGTIAAPAPAGGALGEAAAAANMPRLANALASSGMTTGTRFAPATGMGAGVTNTLGNRAVDMGIRMAGGAGTVGATTALASPDSATAGTAIGAFLPPALKGAGALGGAAANATQAAANRLMQSALKPTIAQLKNGDAATAVQTLLDYGINPTERGVNKLRGLISDLNDQIATAVGTSDATVSKQKVVNALANTRTKFGNQVSPTADLNAIGGVESDFLNHPLMPSQEIPVQAAQQMKQGTYRVLEGKYGQLGSAETEAQKALARGLKDEIASAVPGVGALNAEESRLLKTLTVTERRALMDMNKNPMGLAALAHNPASWAMFMADKSAAFKSVAARMLNVAASTAKAPPAQNMLEVASNPLLRAGLSGVARPGPNGNP